MAELTELERLIRFWEDTLKYYNFLIEPTTQYFIGQTIKELKALRDMREGK